MENIVEIKGVNKKFERFKLEDVSFNLKKGTVMGLIGANGAGKTSIIKAIVGLNCIDSGEINILGVDIFKNPKIKDKIGLVYDTPIGFPTYRIEKNIRIIKKFYSNWDDEIFNYYLKKFSLDPFEKLKNLSKGQEMRYSLAIALSHKAELLILDEPTAGLDAVVRVELLDILFDLVDKEELSVLYSTHITADLEKIADYITFIKKGKVEFSMEKDLLLERVLVVKGNIEDLTEEVEEKIVGLRKHKYGFEGITTCKDEILSINPNLLIEEASLDEIIVGFTRV